MPSIWHYTGDKLGKFLVLRRDATIPNWPHFVLGARDPYAEATLRYYANEVAKQSKHDKEYVESVRKLADEFAAYRKKHGNGDPEAPKHREDDSRVLSAMRGAAAWIRINHQGQ